MPGTPLIVTRRSAAGSAIWRATTLGDCSRSPWPRRLASPVQTGSPASRPNIMRGADGARGCGWVHGFPSAAVRFLTRSGGSSTRRGLKWGVVGGAVLGVIFPPSIIGSALVLRAVGAATGKASAMHRRSELSKELWDAVAPGLSGILALVSNPSAVEIPQDTRQSGRHRGAGHRQGGRRGHQGCRA